jgi:hypothetical protein
MSPFHMITGFWAHLSWDWPRQTDWTSCLCKQDFHATINDHIPIASSKEHIIIEWQCNWTPIPHTDSRCHYPILADPPNIDLHPCTKGVLSAGSRKIQCTIFQLTTGHCFSADYSIRFRLSARDHLDCPRCGELYTAHHILDNSNCYIIERCNSGDSLNRDHHQARFSHGENRGEERSKHHDHHRSRTYNTPAVPSHITELIRLEESYLTIALR